MMELLDPIQMFRWSLSRRLEGKRIAFVPTMGALHEGHLSLVDRAHELADVVVVSMFVNPLQFGPDEDFDRYPRERPRDRELAAARDVECLFVPTQELMYPGPPVVTVHPGRLADHLCGPYRPGHFAGVLTVVAKLLQMVDADVAVVGRKDAQQARMIAQMARDLSFKTTIEVAPTVREPDGLALSSRNAHLSAAERRAAPALARGLEAAHQAFRDGARDAATVLARARELIAGEPALTLQYLEAVDPVMLQPVREAAADTVIALAAFAGTTRLIDNVVLGEGTGGDIRVDA